MNSRSGILSALRHLSAKRARTRCFASFAEAHRAAVALGHTYEDHQMAQLVVDKTKQSLLRDDRRRPISAVTLRSLWALQRLTHHRSSLRVLDFGGAAGQHFFEARAFLGKDQLNEESDRSRVRLSWRVVETEAMVTAASALAGSDLQFYSSVESALQGFEPDLVLSSGALQCLPNPLRTLESLVSIGATYLFLTRLSCSPNDTTSFIVEEGFIHNQGPAVSVSPMAGRAAYPLTIVPVKEMERVLETRYTIETVLDESELAPNTVGTTKSLRRGYFCRLA